MRFMMFMYPGISEEEWNPSAEALETMGRYNEEMRKAGLLLSLDGLHPPAEGGSVSFEDGKTSVVDGPFTEAKEVVGGYWLIQARSKEEALEWASRCPGENCRIEVRRVFWRGWCGTSAWPRTWRRTPWWRRWRSGRPSASRTTRAPG
jgi:hypothetical protein